MGVISAVAPPWEQGEPPPAGRGAGQRCPTRPSETFAKPWGGCPEDPHPRIESPGSRPGQAGAGSTRSHRERGQEPPQLRGRGALCNGLPEEGKEALPQEHTREKDDGSLRGMDSDQSDPPPAVGSWVTASRMMPGACNGFRREASLGPPKCSPRFWPGVQFLPGCVHFPAKCVHFFPPTAPNVFTRPAHVFTRSLDGDSRRPGLPGRSGSDFGGRAALGTRRARARGPGQRSPTCPSETSAKTEGLVARKTLTPTLSHGERGKMAVWPEGGPGVTGDRPGGRRGLRRGPGGRTGGRGRCGGTGRCRP